MVLCMEISGKTVLITGASSGIGRAAACMAAEYGANVVNADIRHQPRRDVKPTDEYIKSEGGEAIFVKTDVTEFDQVQNAVDASIDRFGDLDVMINNAGRAESYAIDENPLSNWQEIIELNLTGVYHGCRAAIEEMVSSGGGAIVNVGSVVGTLGIPNSTSYGASKGGVLSLTRQIAYDYASEGIRANTVSPGFVHTALLHQDTQEGTTQFAEDKTPMQRLGDPEEIAEAIVFLSSDSASFITGQDLIVDGGYSIA